MRKINKEKPLLVIAVRVILFLLGGLLILSAGRVQPGSQPYAILFGLGLALVTSVIVTVLSAAFGADVSSQIEEKLGFQKKTHDLGLEAVWPERGSDDLFQRFRGARNIDLMYNTGKSTVFRYGSLIAEAISKHGCNVRLLVADPNNAVFQDENCKLGLCPGTNITGEIRDTLSNLDELLKTVGTSSTAPRSGSFEVRTYSCAPTGSLVIIDGTHVRHIPYLPYSHSSQVPVWDVTQLRGGELFSRYASMFDRVWQSSELALRVEFDSEMKVSRNTDRFGKP